MMYVTLLAQTALVALVLLLSAPKHDHPPARDRVNIRCRLYFGCVPNVAAVAEPISFDDPTLSFAKKRSLPPIVG
jgi:hypothetical protein